MEAKKVSTEWEKKSHMVRTYNVEKKSLYWMKKKSHMVSEDI